MGLLTVSFRDTVFCFFMRLTVNGELFNAEKSETLADLLEELRIGPERVAVEINLTIVKKADYSTFRLKEDDRVEIVNFVGGG
jgi:sulfur carrier protein